MLTAIQDQDDRRRASHGMVLSVAQKDDGTLRLSLDRVDATSTTLPSHWDFKVFQGHYDVDQSFLGLVENEARKPDNDRSEEGIGVPDSVLLSIGRALVVPLMAAAIEAREAGPV